MSNKDLNSNKLFNSNKGDYEKPSLFLGEPAGLFDTINKQYPVIWDLYKEMKQLQWDENDADFTPCLLEFKSAPRATYEMMILNLAYQWETDSMVSRAITSIVSMYNPSSELWACWQEISSNEVVHAASYSEIIRNSFDDPSVILDEILKVQESLSRLSAVTNVMEVAYTRGHQYALGLVENDQETYNAIFMFTVAMYALERIQFMASFAVTFAICDTGMFQPIGKTVQKIANDEYNIHVALDREVLRNELRTERGKIAMKQCDEMIKNLLDEVTDVETSWARFLFTDGRELVGVTCDMLIKWTHYNAAGVYDFFGHTPEFEVPKTNPLKYMEEWIDISNIQPAPQEQDHLNYKMNVIKREEVSEDFLGYF